MSSLPEDRKARDSLWSETENARFPDVGLGLTSGAEGELSTDPISGADANHRPRNNVRRSDVLSIVLYLT